MLKRVYILLVTIIFYPIHAQDSLKLKVAYTLEINLNNTYQLKDSPIVDCYLYIEDGVSRFNMHYEEAEKKYPGEIYKHLMSVYKNFNENEMYGRSIGYKSNEYVIKDSLNIIDWKLQEDSTKIINGKLCKLATTHWRDHDWEAWYDENITIADGPYKLNGLPGLILEAKAKSCNNSVYYFKLKDIEFTNTSLKKNINFPFKNEGFKFISYSEMYNEATKNQMYYLKNNYLKSVESNSNNNIEHGSTCISSITFDYCICYP